MLVKISGMMAALEALNTQGVGGKMGMKGYRTKVDENAAMME
jgi:hypothetical protein